MYAEKHTIALTTAADGSATAYTALRLTGRILAVIYAKTDFDDGVDFTITLEGTGEAILTLTNQNASGKFYPRVPVQDETGADALYAAGGTKLRDAVVAVFDRVKVVVAQGGNVKTGAITVIVG
jgi:hypothetical protein